MSRLAYVNKITSLPQIQILTLTLILRDLSSLNFSIQACTQKVCSTSREKKTSQHGISVVLNQYRGGQYSKLLFWRVVYHSSQKQRAAGSH